ncbi:MAG: TolC family protein [Acidobacteria bacterium]|nr:TolC family protein [Acidobacteriota bacterium]
MNAPARLNHARLVCLIGLLLWAWPSLATAQDTASLRLSLEDAQSRALAASHRLAEARARATTAENAIAVREAADRPIVAVVGGYTRTNHVTEFVVPSATGAPRVLYPDVPDNYRTRLDAQWPIYNGGRADALERAARAEASAASADVAAAQADLRLEVARAYWALVTARAASTVLEQGLARAQSQLKDARERLTAGLVPPNDVASAEAQESRQRMLLIETRNQRDTSSAELARLMGVDLLQSIEPMAELDTAATPLSEQQVLVEEARAKRNERQALELRITAADSLRDAAERARYPMISLAGGVDVAKPNPRIFPRADRWEDSWDVGVTASWALWDSGRVRADAAQAASVVVAARQRLAEFDSVVALEVRQRVLEIDSGRAAIAASADAVRAAAEARRVVVERYRAGVITQTEVLDADVALLQAELDRTRALAGVRLAEARLNRALGR